ncbi:glycosyltransferase [Terriglobus roseus DSM 18391]|uniref:Glycosyltransferase n=1 Tax=Terriglobus roseus (strain DSM 18391 / NRRL B-41598 / KBS 63) TaxID=926566 RepID=I3ZE41_TERRK|nr:glycosyltransferase family 1 protein [Terriglobus roseus]AFL87509.1 glycosyltransferase [Terriglobus roseus DSM 18391]
MRVTLPFVSAARQVSGVQRHAVNVAKSLLLSQEITALTIVVAPWQEHLIEMLPADERLKLVFTTFKDSSWSRNRWYYDGLPTICEAADIVHLSYPVPVHHSAYPCPIVTSLHDMYPFDLPENFGLVKGHFNRYVLRSCLHAVDAIACVSQSTMARLEIVEPRLALTKAVVIPNAVEPGPEERPRILRPRSAPFLLCVAQHRRNKQLLLLLEVFVALLRSGAVSGNMQLIIVGISGPETPAIHAVIRKYRLEDRVRTVSGLSDRQLQELYQRCDALIAPSSIEGFGLPVVEAILAGCRVVCSDIAAFREVGNSSCNFVRLGTHEVGEFVAAIEKALRRPKPRPVKRPDLSLGAVSEQYLSLYRSLLQPISETASSRLAGAAVKRRREVEV